MSSSSPDSTGTIFHGIGFGFGKLGIINDLDFLERAGIIEGIKVHSEGYYNPLAFQEAWGHYSPKEVILTYGPPSRVWVEATSHFIEPTDSQTIGYSLWLFYDDLGFLVQYSAAVKYDSIYRMCPAVENESEGMKAIDLFLQSSSNQTPLEDSSALLAPGTMDYIKPIEEAAGLSPEEFYRLFTQNGQAACFETPQNIWP